MEISKAPMMTPLLCKHKNAQWSEVFEVMKLGISKNGKAAYIRVIINSNCQHYWRDIADLDGKWEVFDELSIPNPYLQLSKE